MPSHLPAHDRASAGRGLLDNPIWNALCTGHAALAMGGERARRYPPHIGPLSGIPNQSALSYEALHALAAPGEALALFSVEPPQPTPGWTITRSGRVHQMVLSAAGKRARVPGANGTDIRRLAAKDAPAMVELAELTEPGPFRLRTIELGSFFGAFHSGKLVAMAGQRMRLPGFVEVSGVCTHPDARGRGYAASLMSLAIDEIVEEGNTPFLHVMTGNEAALHVYEKLGFAVRQTFHLAVLKYQAR